MVLEQGVTERAEAIRMKRQLTYAGVKIIGAVLNKVGADPNGYGYGYGEEQNDKKKKSKK